MTIEELVETYKAYRTTAVLLDLVSLGINICIMIVLLFQTRYVNKKQKNCFLISIGVVMSVLVTEIISKLMAFNPNYLVLYKMTVTLDYFLYLVMPASTFYLINTIIDDKVNMNKHFQKIFYSLFFIIAFPVLIPPFRNLLITFDDELVAYQVTSFSFYYFAIEIIAVLIGVLVGLKYAKKIGINNTILIVLFLIVPPVSLYLNYTLSSTFGLIFMSYTMILLIGLTYQDRLSIEREVINKRQLELSEAKTKLLMNQIQPHFIFNTLTTLKYLCEVEPTKASSLCDSFAQYLRTNIDAIDDSGLIPFEKEIENIQNYLNIEKARFDEKLNYVFDIKETNFVLPVLSIEPIVENAVKKGICKKIEGGTVWISSYKENGNYIVRVVDNGVGFNIDDINNDKKNHVGIKNVKYRLEMVNGHLDIQSEIGKGTTVTVTIPEGEY